MRRFRLLFLSAAAFVLIGARASVVPLPDVLLPDHSVEMSTIRTVQPGDVILRADILRAEMTSLEKPVQVEIDKFKENISNEMILTTVIANDKTKKIVKSQADLYYCADDIRARSSFMSWFMGDIGSKFENIVRFCFIDNDNDFKFDHYFLAGAKDPALLQQREIDPLPYHIERLVHEDVGDEIRLRYRKFDRETAKVHLELEITRNGKPFTFQYIVSPNHTGRNEQYYRLNTNPRKIPYPMHFMDILGADVGIRSVSSDGAAEVIINKNFEPSFIKPYIPEVRYIFVYI